MERIPLEIEKTKPMHMNNRTETGMGYHSEPQHELGKINPLFQDDREEMRTRYQPEPRLQDHDRASPGSMNLQTFPDRPRAESVERFGQPTRYGPSYASEDPYRRQFQNGHQSGPEGDYRRQNQRNDIDDQRRRSEETSISDERYVYLEGKSGDRRMFKRVDDEKLGGSVRFNIVHAFNLFSLLSFSIGNNSCSTCKQSSTI